MHTRNGNEETSADFMPSNRRRKIINFGLIRRTAYHSLGNGKTGSRDVFLFSGVYLTYENTFLPLLLGRNINGPVSTRN